MAARRTTADESRPMWAFTDRGHVVACPKGLPEGSILFCREGDPAWTPADPAHVVRAPTRPARDGGPHLYDKPEGER